MVYQVTPNQDSSGLLSWIERKLDFHLSLGQVTRDQKERLVKSVSRDCVDFGETPLDSEMMCQDYLEYALGEESALSKILGSLVWIQSRKHMCK